MVIKSDTLNELKKNALYSRQYAAALIAHAERIESLIDAEAAVADIGASQTPAEPARSEPPAEPAPKESAAEPAPKEPPAENSRFDAPVEPSRSEPPALPPRIEAPVEPARVVAVPLTLPRAGEMPRPNRELGVTQADAIKAALRVIGHPATLGEIFNTIKSQRLPVKLTSAENLRLVMSRSEDFESNMAGQWQLRPSAAGFSEPAPGNLVVAGQV